MRRLSYGEPIYWDQNFGPSSSVQCCEKYEPVMIVVGTIPSESFTILGRTTTTDLPAR